MKETLQNLGKNKELTENNPTQYLLNFLDTLDGVDKDALVIQSLQVEGDNISAGGFCGGENYEEKLQAIKNGVENAGGTFEVDERTTTVTGRKVIFDNFFKITVPIEKIAKIIKE